MCYAFFFGLLFLLLLLELIMSWFKFAYKDDKPPNKKDFAFDKCELEYIEENAHVDNTTYAVIYDYHKKSTLQ